jgi:hypothetical protein
MSNLCGAAIASLSVVLALTLAATVLNSVPLEATFKAAINNQKGESNE